MRAQVPTLLLALTPGEAGVASFLREKGFRVLLAAHGAEALHLAVAQTPDLVLFDEECGVLDAESFSRIVRSNARLSKVPVLTIGRDPRLATLAKPLHHDRVIQAVEAALAHAETSTAGRGAEVTTGVLGPLSTVDLLQPIRSQRGSGKLVLRTPAGDGTIWVGEGEIVDARLGRYWGKKALFRLLSSSEGSFELHPVGKLPSRRIFEPFDFLVLEAARQKDELAEQLRHFPEGKRLTAAVDPKSVPAKPSLSWLLERLWGDALTVQEIVDSLHLPDLEVVTTLLSAYRIGWVQVAPGPATSSEPLVSTETRRLLSRRLGKGAHRGQVLAKIALVGDDPDLVARALRSLSRSPQVHLHARAHWGTVATVDLGEGVLLDLVALPPGEELAPLALFLSRGVVGALLAGAAEAWKWLDSTPPRPAVEILPLDPHSGLRALLGRLAEGEAAR